MDLLEYQAKQLFQEVGIPVLPSQSIAHTKELKNLLIPYPIVLKSQVLASGRALVGGVKFVENTIDAIAAAQYIFNLPIEGEYPEVILAEARYDAENELFLAIMLDYTLKKPVLVGSAYGGININLLLENLQTCVLESEFSLFYARRLVKQMGLTGNVIASVSQIIAKMYDLFTQYDLDSIEINPLGVNSQGEVMALDGKIRINDHALHRHPKLLSYLRKEKDHQYYTNNNQNLPSKYTSLKINLHSDVAIISDSIDLGIYTINSLIYQEVNPYKYYLISTKNKEIQEENLNEIFRDILNNEQIKVVLINIINQSNSAQDIIKKLGQYYQKEITNRLPRNSDDRADGATGLRLLENQPNIKIKSSQPPRKINWILRTISPQFLVQEEELLGLPCELINDFDRAIEATISYHQKSDF